jgi:hypothetical protein
MAKRVKISHDRLKRILEEKILIIEDTVLDRRY